MANLMVGTSGTVASARQLPQLSSWVQPSAAGPKSRGGRFSTSVLAHLDLVSRPSAASSTILQRRAGDASCRKPGSATSPRLLVPATGLADPRPRKPLPAKRRPRHGGNCADVDMVQHATGPPHRARRHHGPCGIPTLAVIGRTPKSPLCAILIASSACSTQEPNGPIARVRPKHLPAYLATMRTARRGRHAQLLRLLEILKIPTARHHSR